MKTPWDKRVVTMMDGLESVEYRPWGERVPISERLVVKAEHMFIVRESGATELRSRRRDDNIDVRLGPPVAPAELALLVARLRKLEHARDWHNSGNPNYQVHIYAYVGGKKFGVAIGWDRRPGEDHAAVPEPASYVLARCHHCNDEIEITLQNLRPACPKCDFTYVVQAAEMERLHVRPEWLSLDHELRSMRRALFPKA